jgi:tetratricopeptide (TPR) repeat protein
MKMKIINEDFSRLQELKRDKKFSEAILLINKMILVNPEIPALYIERGNLFFDLGKNDEALNDFNYVIEKETDKIIAYKARAIFYFSNKKFEKAKKDLDFIIQNSEVDLKFYVMRAFVHRELNDYVKAIEDAIISKELDPSNFMSYRILSDAYTKLENYPMAIEAYNKLIEFNSHYQFKYGMYFNRGRLYLEIGKYDEALKDLLLV